VRIAFKEWAIVVDALGRGEQIIILRKGGISEGRDGFKVEHERFLLFPTLFHQQRESVIESAQARYGEISGSFPKADRVRIEFYAEVVDWTEVTSLQEAERLRGQHIWRDGVIAERFEWGRKKEIYAIAVRVWRVPNLKELAMRDSYGGCKSWIEFEEEVSTEGAEPVLSEAQFEEKLTEFRKALGQQTQKEPTHAMRSGVGE